MKLLSFATILHEFLRIARLRRVAKQTRKQPISSSETVYRTIPVPGVQIGLSRNSRRLHVKARKTSAIVMGALFLLPWILLAVAVVAYRERTPPTHTPREVCNSVAQLP